MTTLAPSFPLPTDRPSIPPFKAHWDASFGHLVPPSTDTITKIKRVAWDVLSVAIPLIGLARLGAYCLRRLAIRTVLLPTTLRKGLVMGQDFSCPPFFFDPVEVVTPDETRLHAIFVRHRDAVEDTPTIIYFNPNGAISADHPYAHLLNGSIFRRTPYPCNFVVFDYRETGGSAGTCTSFNDLVVDGASIVQWVREEIKTPANRIHFYGWSLGGAVAAHVKALDPSNTPGHLVSERSLASSDAMIDAHGHFLCFSPHLLPIIKRLSRWIGLSFDVIPAFQKLVGRKLVIYHPQDPVIPYAASLAQYIQENNMHERDCEVIRLTSQPAEFLFGNAHCTHLFAYPELANVRNFLFQ